MKTKLRSHTLCYLPLGVGLLVAVHFVLASWHVIRGDLLFTSDIARDFFLLQELAIKKIVLIGPQSSVGLFHGPLWLYVNLPSFLLGGGNPLVVGWGWIVLVMLATLGGAYCAYKLFGRATAYLFALMFSLYCVFHAHGLFNPHGAMFLIVPFFYTFVEYCKTHKLKYLFAHLVIAGAVIQFQMAVGIPLFILSFLALVYLHLKTGRLKRVPLLFLIVFSVANFIVFDIRHEFLISQLTFRFLTTAGRDEVDFLALLYERARLLFTGTEIVRRDPGYWNMVLTALVGLFVYFQIKSKKHVLVYILFLYFYAGFYALSLLSAGNLLYFYLFPLFPLMFLVFSSFVTSQYKVVFLVFFGIVYAYNLHTAVDDTLKAEQKFIGKDLQSWKFLYSVSSDIFERESEPFGYFVYAPDTFAFAPKYAATYAEANHPEREAYYFAKRQITYIIASPPPVNDPYITDTWWRENRLNLSNEAEYSTRYDNGLSVQKYVLDEEAIHVPFDPGIDPGIHFR